MKIIIAPDSFKGSLSSQEAALAMENGVLVAAPDSETDKIPMADGGEGTLEALTTYVGGKIVEAESVDPLGRRIKSRYAILEKEKRAVVEMAASSGLTLLGEGELNPMLASTYGTGLLIKRALKSGARELIISAGGSGTNDCGTGMAQALGVRFFRKDKSEIHEKMNGGLLGEVSSIDLGGLLPAITNIRVLAACDVKNPLLGDNGCARVYAPQKGADSRMTEKLEENMASFIEVAEKATGKSVRDFPGSGAGGGFGAGMMLFLGAELRSGADIVMDALSFDQRIKDADLILTGEGRIDGQTIQGKVVSAIARRAIAIQIPVVAFGGALGKVSNLYDLGVTSCFSICEKPSSLEQALKESSANLQKTVERVMRVIALFAPRTASPPRPLP